MKAATEFMSPKEAALDLGLPLLGSMRSPGTTTGAVAATLPGDPKSRNAYHETVTHVLELPLVKAGSIGVVGDVDGSRQAQVASWIAASIAVERPVILVDADLRGAHLSFDERGRAQEGLVDVLRYGVRSPRVVSPTRTMGLNLLPVGSGTLDLAGTFGSGAVPALFEELRRTGDLIVINGPSLTDFQAAAPFLTQVAAWILVHELGSSESHKTRMLRSTFGPAKCLGVVTLEAGKEDMPSSSPQGTRGEAAAPAGAPSLEEIAAWTEEAAAEGRLAVSSQGPPQGEGTEEGDLGIIDDLIPGNASSEGDVTPGSGEGTSRSETGSASGDVAAEPVGVPEVVDVEAVEPEPPRLHFEVKPPGARPDEAEEKAPEETAAEAATQASVGTGKGSSTGAEATTAGESPARQKTESSAPARRPSAVLWIAGVAALAVALFFLVRNSGEPGGAPAVPEAPEPVRVSRPDSPADGLAPPPARSTVSEPSPVTSLLPEADDAVDVTVAEQPGAGPLAVVSPAPSAVDPPAEQGGDAEGRRPESTESTPGPAAAPEEDTAIADAPSEPSPEPEIIPPPRREPGAAAPATGKPYFVHVSSLASREAARIDALRVQRAGFPTSLKQVELGARGTWWRVYLGPYETKSDADAASAQAKKKNLTDYTQVYRLEREEVEVGTGQEIR